MIDNVGTSPGNSMLANKSDVTSSPVTSGLLVIFSLVAWAWEIALLTHLWLARGNPADAPALRYILPIVHPFPWLAAMQWLWKVRRAVRTGTLEAAGGSMCCGAVISVLSGAYVALGIVEGALLSVWKV
jgi:hypothetical protein